MILTVRAMTGNDLERVLPDLAQLRMQVFRDWPYLYEGSFDYEHRYLQSYRDSTDAVLVGAFDGDRIVGAATGTPLEDHAQDFGAAFAAQDADLTDIYYFAESVLLPAYRGQGIGHRFFDHREAHARALGRRFAAFCAVQRPPDHPARPIGYLPLNAFWRARGYQMLDGVVAAYSWRDVGLTQDTPKPMQFWMRAL